MDIGRAEVRIMQLMDRHGLFHRGWKYAWNKRLHLLGSCSYKFKVLSFSRPIFEANDEAIVTDTILHEIAHALVGKNNGHGQAWKEACVRIGAIPKAAVTCPLNPALYKYAAACPHCGRKYYRHRLLRRVRRRGCSCVFCCRKYNGGLFSEKFRLRFRKRRLQPTSAIPAIPEACPDAPVEEHEVGGGDADRTAVVEDERGGPSGGDGVGEGLLGDEDGAVVGADREDIGVGGEPAVATNP